MVANDRAAATEQQLQTKLAAKETPGLAAGKSFARFVKERFISLVLGVVMFLVVFGLFKLLGYLTRTGLAAVRNNKPVTVPMRAGSLVYKFVSVFAASESSLTYEIDVDLDGSTASEYEEVQRIISRILVDAANANGWQIPFQQLVIHQAEVA